LEHGHGEADNTTGGGIGGLSLDRLIFDVASQSVIEIPFFVIELERNRSHVAFGEQLFHLTGVRIGECYKRFLGAPQVERRGVPLHGLFETLDVAVHVSVQQPQEQAEMLRIALMRSGGHQQIVIRHAGEVLAKLVCERLLVGAGSRHFMSFIYDDEIPRTAEQAVAGILDPRHPRDGGDDLILVLPGICAVVGTQDIATDDLEFLPKLILHLPLPLERQIRGRDD